MHYLCRMPPDFNFPVRRSIEHGHTQDLPGSAFSLVETYDTPLQYENPDGSLEVRIPVTILPVPVWEAHLAPVAEKKLTQRPKGGFEFL